MEWWFPGEVCLKSKGFSRASRVLSSRLWGAERTDGAKHEAHDWVGPTLAGLAPALGYRV